MAEWNISNAVSFSMAILISTIALAGFVTYYFVFVCKKPKIYCNNAQLKMFIEKHLKVVTEKYYPAPLYFEGRLQTFIGVLQREIKPKLLPYSRDIVHLQDGGQLALDVLEPSNHENCKSDESLMACNGQSEKPLVVLLLPGLTSSSQECYMKTVSLAITQAGAIAVALNNRGIGGVDIKTPRLFSASNCEDLAEVVDYLHKKFPLHRIMAIGISMGGMQLCHFMIKYPEKAKRLVAAMLVSIIWDTIDGLKNLESGFLNKFILNRAITGNLVHYARMFRKDLDSRDCWDFDKILQSKTICQFDDTFTGPQFGFPNAEAYYMYSRVSGRVDKFPIPVFGLSAADDPFQPGKYLPVEEALANGSNLALIVSEYGGHVGFLEGFLPLTKRINYLERIVIDIVQAIRIHGEDLVLTDKEIEI